MNIKDIDDCVLAQLHVGFMFFVFFLFYDVACRQNKVKASIDFRRFYYIWNPLSTMQFNQDFYVESVNTAFLLTSEQKALSYELFMKKN